MEQILGTAKSRKIQFDLVNIKSIMIPTDEIFAGDWFKSIHLLLPDTLMLLIGSLGHLCFIALPGHHTERQILNSTVNIMNQYLQLCGTPSESSLVLLTQTFA